MKMYFILRKVVFVFLFLSFTELFAQYTYQLSITGDKKLNNTTLNEPMRNVDELAFDGVELTYEISYLNISSQSINNVDYSLIDLPGFGTLKNIGAPAVPARTDFIALPIGAKPKIEIINSEYKEFKNFMVYPELEPARDTEGAPEPEFKIDEKVYGENAFYPQAIAEVSDVQIMRKVPMAMIQTRPVQFNPVTKTLRVYSQFTYRVVFEGDNKSFATLGKKNSQQANLRLKSVVLNPDLIDKGIERTANSKSIDKNYIIITHDEYMPAARKLADWKRQLGYGVEIVSKSNWTAEIVKAEIHNRYDNWDPKPDYFVIIGDHDGSYAVPGEIHQCPDNEDFATDLYYACMDGAGDYLPDIGHGRISVSSLDEANIIVDKIINYEKNPVSDPAFYQNGLNCAQYQDDDNNGYADRRFCHSSEDVRDYLVNEQGYAVDRIYYTSSNADVTNLRYNQGYYSNGQLLPDELRNASFDWDGGASEITQAINAGKFYVLHRDHGYSGASGWAHPYYTLSSMDALSNGDLQPIVFSINCHTGEYQLYAFAEKFMRMQDKGAVGVVAAAYYSYSGYNDALISGVFDAIWPEPGLTFQFGYGGISNPPPSGPPPAVRTMGDAVDYGLLRMVETWDGGYSANRYQYELFLYFGDPAMKIWTENPYSNMITADFTDTIDCSGSIYEISNSTVDSALVTLVQGGEVVGMGYTSGDTADINYSLISNGEVVITFSKENHKVLTDTITSYGSCSYAPLVETGVAENVSYDNAEIHGEIISNNGENVTSSGIVISTEPDPIIGGDNVIMFETDPLVASGEFIVLADGLDGSTNYYYRAFATNAIGTTYGFNESFLTDCSPISEFPFTYDFESDYSVDCWYTEYVSGEVDWQLDNGNGSSVPNAYNGDWNLRFYDNDTEDDKTRMITPFIHLAGNNYALLSFYHLQANFFDYQDELRVFYKNPNTSDWVQIAEYTEAVDDWTKQELLLPDLTDDYKITFEGNAKMAYGVGIDYMQIFVADADPIVQVSATALTFEDTEVGLQSETQSYTISASDLLGRYYITAPDGFLITDNETNEFTNSMAIENDGGVVTDVEIFVRFAPSEAMEYNNSIVNSSPGAEEVLVAVSGTGTPSSVSELNKTNKLYIYPNPAEDKLNINYNANNQFSMQILDATGNKVGEWSAENNQISIDVSGLSAGLYYVKLIDKENTLLKKFVIK